MPLNPNLHSTSPFFTLSPELMASLTPEGKILEVNPAWETSLGFPAEQLSETVFFDLLHPEDRPKAMVEIKRLSRGKQEKVSFESRCQDKAGAVHTLVWTLLANPEQDFWILMGRDVTDWRKAERALAESREKFQKLSDASAEGVAFHERGVVLEANEALARMFGYEQASEMVGKNGLDLTDAPGREMIRRHIQSHSEESYEVTGLRQDGSAFPCQIRSREIFYQGRAMRVSTFLDMTSLREREKEILESEEKFRCLAQAATEGVGITLQGKILEVNHALARMFGYEPSEMIGRSAMEFCAPESLAEMTRMALSDKEEPYEGIGIRKDGAKIPLQITGRAIPFRGHKVRVAVFKDMTQQREAETARSQSEARLRAVFNSGSQTMVVLDRQGRLESFNTRAEEEMKKIRGLTLETGRFMAEYLDPALLTVFQENFEKSLQGQTLLSERQVAGLEQDHWFEFQYHPVLDEQGQTIAVCVTSVCIDDRKKAQDTLLQSEERYRRLVEFSPDSIFVYTNETIVYVNPAGLKLLGASDPGQVVGLPILSLAHPDDRLVVARRIENVTRNRGVNPPLEQKFMRVDGQSVEVEAQGTSFAYMGKPAGLMIARDITQRKKAIQAFRESQESYRRLVEFFPETVLVHSEGKLLYINPPGLKMFGAVEPGEILGRSIFDFVSTPFLETARIRVESIYLNKLSTDPMDQVWLKLDGSPIDVEVRGTFFNFMGKPSILSILRNVSERKRTQQMLLRYERLAAVGQVIAGIAHDIRNPLAVLSSMTIHLKEKFEGSASVSKEVETITTQTNRLKRLMNDILDYAKGYTLVKQEIEPKAFLEQCLKLVQTQVGPSHRKIQVRWKIDSPLTSFTADRERLEQVLLNLILNAYEALEKGGVLTLGFEEIDQMVCLKVEDNGPGIPEGAITRLFEPFFTTKKYGSGLGLSLSQKIAEAHGGKIEAEWVYPHGTLFTVQIPKELS